MSIRRTRKLGWYPISCQYPPAGGFEGLLGGGRCTFAVGDLATASSWPSAEARAGLTGAGGFSLSLSFLLSPFLPLFPSSFFSPSLSVGTGELRFSAGEAGMSFSFSLSGEGWMPVRQLKIGDCPAYGGGVGGAG